MLRLPRWATPPPLAIALALLAAIASLLPIPVSFGGSWSPGSIATVLALLRLGWWGLPVAATEGLASAFSTGYWSLPLALLEALTLQLFLERLNNGRRNADNGRIILADLAFWLLAGGPLVLLLHGVAPGVGSRGEFNIALVTGLRHVFNTTLGFTLFLVVKQYFPSGNGVRGISIRGLSMSVVLLAIALPTFTVSTLLAQTRQWNVQVEQALNLQQVAQLVLSLPPREQREVERSLASTDQPIDLEIRREDGQVRSSDPALFRELRENFVPYEGPLRDRPRLQLLLPKLSQPVSQLVQKGYWLYESVPEDAPAAPATLQRIQVVQPSWVTLEKLRNQNLRTTGLVAWVILIGALISDALGRSLDRQFSRVIAPILRHQEVRGHGRALLYAVPPLATSYLRELNTMVKLINSRVKRVNRLTLELEDMNAELERSRQELQHLSTTDPLTGCFNRRELHRRLEEEILRADRQGAPLSCLCFDIDYFKRVNDTYGHGMGDAVLCTVAEAVRSRLRATDCFCRSGGEEFTILLPLCPTASAISYAELLRQTVALASTSLERVSVQVTISVGLSTYAPGRDDAEQLLARADRALYRAKESGRNQVQFEALEPQTLEQQPAEQQPAGPQPVDQQASQEEGNHGTAG
ncbi:MAG: GGDEF domain-containing protein [Synechococcus sp.]|nr:GGDEF domain-containing protein [Synechococcus sp.]